MSRTDKQYLVGEQYRDDKNLKTRGSFHERFATNVYGLFPWLFDQFALPEQAQILEVGAGTGALWQINRARMPSGWHITLSDLSPGMLDSARQNLAGATQFSFETCDVQELPFADAAFDAVIANFMLYHVPDRPRAYAEMQRVLRPGGQLYAATTGKRHLQELDELLQRFDPRLQRWSGSVNPFKLEDREQELRRYFDDVRCLRYDDSLKVTEVEPLVSYVRSMDSSELLVGETLIAFEQYIADAIAQTGVLAITKDFGLVIATR
jgi:ubiquinone/menaquinone biosynthesis C-methylase UbiE